MLKRDIGLGCRRSKGSVAGSRESGVNAGQWIVGVSTTDIWVEMGRALKSILS